MLRAFADAETRGPGRYRPGEILISTGDVRKNAGVTGRWHDNRHTLVTDLAESGAGDETIRQIAGHVSKRMLKHYSHICMEAKRRALEAIVPRSDINRTPNVDSVSVETPFQPVISPPATVDPLIN
jgi:hypothetical protein